MPKRYLPLLLLLPLLAVYSCKKLAGHAVQPGTPSSGTTSPTTSASSIDTTKGYQPMTANSYLKYRETMSTGVIDTNSQTIAGTTTLINGKTYSVVTAKSQLYGTSTGYFSNINHAYTTRATTLVSGTTVEFLYLIDNVGVGATWTAPLTDNGIVNGVPGRVSGVITEKNITKTVSGITFNSVVHTTLQLQYDLGSGFVNYATYDFYVAKGVGVIQVDAVLAPISGSSLTTSTKIIDFSIK